MLASLSVLPVASRRKRSRPSSARARKDLSRFTAAVRHALDLAEIAARKDPRRAALYLVQTAADFAPEMARLRAFAFPEE
jgi:hypothetical protein